MNRKKIIFFRNIGYEILRALGIMVFVTLSVFLFIHWMPGSDADSSWLIDPGKITHANQSVLAKYSHWMLKAVQFDFGDAIWQPYNVLTAIRSSFPVTILLLLGALFVSVILSLVIGVLWATRVSSFFVRSLHLFSSFFSSIPVYLLGVGAFIGVFFYVRTQQLTVDYNEIWRLEGIQEQSFPLSLIMYLIPPTLLGVGNGNLIELTVGIKNSIHKIINTEFMKAVRARGASVTKHVAKNLFLDLVSSVDARITYLISGAVIIENVFNWSGLGMLGVKAAKDYDYPVIMALVMLFTCIVLFVRICKFSLFYLIDPRFRATDNTVT